MKVFITGGNGFVGQKIIRQLLQDGYSVKALVRQKNSLKDYPPVEKVVGDITDPENLKDQLHDCHAVIHLVGIIREYPSRGITFDRIHRLSTSHLVTAAQAQGVERFIHMSANGTSSNATTNYHKTKWAAEELLRRSELDWTIFRPSLIFGPDDAFINMLAKILKITPVFPVFGDGNYRLQPVHVSNVAESFVAALAKPETIGQIYHCCGPQVYSYNELIDVIHRALGKKGKALKLHQPLALIKPLLKLAGNCPLSPITADQLSMLVGGNTCSNDEWHKTFNLQVLQVEEEISKYLCTEKMP